MQENSADPNLEALISLSPVQLSHVASMAPQELEALLEAGVSTGAAIICCSELGFTNAGLSRNKDLPIFVWQNLGGCLSDTNGLQEMITNKQIADVIILGHYGCDIIEYGIRSGQESLLSDEQNQTYKQVMLRTTATRAAIQQRFKDRFDKQIMRAAIEDFVLRELTALLNLPSIAQLDSSDVLRCHAWVINQAQQVSSFDLSKRSFWVRHD